MLEIEVARTDRYETATWVWQGCVLAAAVFSIAWILNCMSKLRAKDCMQSFDASATACV